ncbi:MAG: hypothetical protein PHT58_01420 [Eubacteriales bacterium]|nr:hypothetical protein [Eubacteriales bacterium]
MKKFFQNKLVFTLICILGFIILLCVVIFAVIYIGKCTVDSGKVRNEAVVTDAPTPSPVPERNYDEGRTIAFEPEIEKMKLGTLEDEDLLDYSKEHWLDITPNDISEAVGCVIMKHDTKRCTYLYYNGEYLRLDEGSDGYGVIDMQLCDLNYDDAQELVYSYSFGVDDYSSKIGWYDFASGELVISDFSLMGQEIILYTKDGVSCQLYRAQRKGGETTGGYVLHMTDDVPLGVLVEQEGRLFLKLDAK